MPSTGALSPTDFATVKQRFTDLGDRLSDAQLLELADAYHEMLRWRRNLRCRHPDLAGDVRHGGEDPSFVEPEPRVISPIG